MITGVIKNKIDKIWTDIWAGGITNPQILQKIITGLDDLYEHDIADLDMQGDLYEYMLGKLNSAGQNGQFRTPKHIREMMVELIAPTPDDVICDIILQSLIQSRGKPQSAPLRCNFRLRCKMCAG